MKARMKSAASKSLQRTPLRFKDHEKGLPHHQEGVCNFPNPSKTTKGVLTWHIWTHTHPNHTFLTGKQTSRPGEGFGNSPGAPKRQINLKNVSFSPFGVGYPRLVSAARLRCLLSILCHWLGRLLVIPFSFCTSSNACGRACSTRV